jgi:hypothetical protein
VPSDACTSMPGPAENSIPLGAGTGLPFGPSTQSELQKHWLRLAESQHERCSPEALNKPAPQSTQSRPGSAGLRGKLGDGRLPAQRPRSASNNGVRLQRWGITSAVPRSFDTLADRAPANRRAELFGPKHEEYRKKVSHVLDADFSLRKETSTRERDGKLRRQALQAARDGSSDLRMPRSVGGVFSDVPLLHTSEAAVSWYLEFRRAAGEGGETSTKPNTPRDAASRWLAPGDRDKRRGM